jgi:hypothetical protein
MIANETEFRVTQERIIDFQRLLLQLRSTSRPEEFALVSQGYRREIEKMQAEVLDYLTRPIARAG